jgi:hypothetical protein
VVIVVEAAGFFRPFAVANPACPSESIIIAGCEASLI